jgi:AcrR family transcriptional regulator
MTAPASADGATRHPPSLTGVNKQRRRWAKSGATQERILDGALYVFSRNGYTAATISDVVAASGASIGSIYHHFGGKSELFLAIHQRLTFAVGQRITEAGHIATLASFDEQARGYLEAIWTNRRIAAVLGSADVPPGYDRIRRESMQAWFRDWLGMLDIDSTPSGALLMRVLIAVLTESAALVMTCTDDDEAASVIDAAIQHLNRLLGLEIGDDDPAHRAGAQNSAASSSTAGGGNDFGDR